MQILTIKKFVVPLQFKPFRVKKTAVILFFLVSVSASLTAQNRPYIDDKLFHFGFSLGVNFMAYGTTDSGEVIDGEVYHTRTSGMLPGFSVGFITDLRLARYLNLRFCPGMGFASKTISFKRESDEQKTIKTDLLSLPVYIPLYLKWSAEREVNYRPYLIAGGGISYDVSKDKTKPLLQRPLDYFVEVGFGCDFYYTWFKLCPQLTYSIGFNNMLTPVEDRPELAKQDEFYTRAIKRLTNHQITLTFNFE